MAVARRRRLRLQAPVRIVWSTSATHALHPVEHPLGGGSREAVHEPAVGEEEGGVGPGCSGGIVGHHHDGLAEAVGGLSQEAQHLGAGSRVEVARRLVGEEHLGRSEEHTSELQSLMRISYADFCLKKKNNK